MNITGIATKEHGLTPLTNIVSSESIINLIYPVGATFISFDAQFNPNTTWTGTTWELIKEGVFLEATETEAQVGKEIEAGLPEISGTIYTDMGLYLGTHMGESGAFSSTVNNQYCKNVKADSINSVDTSLRKTNQKQFNASKSNATYGKSNTVQPNSIRAFIWRRTA